jgi:hypothetical protein
MKKQTLMTLILAAAALPLPAAHIIVTRPVVIARPVVLVPTPEPVVEEVVASPVIEYVPGVVEAPIVVGVGSRFAHHRRPVVFQETRIIDRGPRVIARGPRVIEKTTVIDRRPASIGRGNGNPGRMGNSLRGTNTAVTKARTTMTTRIASNPLRSGNSTRAANDTRAANNRSHVNMR